MDFKNGMKWIMTKEHEKKKVSGCYKTQTTHIVKYCTLILLKRPF